MYMSHKKFKESTVYYLYCLTGTYSKLLKSEQAIMNVNKISHFKT